ncbi:uncharacterized protein H6S33_012304 [Morchella sextelata]|uniref:uncharacterized protein n=1 Tax=Morchella sextelata TaxID=1174677 RepID=UPI001D038B08|nr:uncharacterized protein H6S33_012304 [Morchella sextelata]KAH0609758.1 hypothetical protein H6S33_012304 [Morchella sextelata]
MHPFCSREEAEAAFDCGVYEAQYQHQNNLCHPRYISHVGQAISNTYLYIPRALYSIHTHPLHAARFEAMERAHTVDMQLHHHPTRAHNLYTYVPFSPALIFSHHMHASIPGPTSLSPDLPPRAVTPDLNQTTENSSDTSCAKTTQDTCTSPPVSFQPSTALRAMFDLPETKRVRRAELFDDFTPAADSPTTSDTHTLDLDLDFVTVAPLPSANPADDPADADLEFSLFSGPRQTVTLKEATPPCEEDLWEALAHSQKRPVAHYVLSEADMALRRQVLLAGGMIVEADEVRVGAKAVWPACKVPHKVITITMRAQPPEPRADGKHGKPSKKSRIAIRKAQQKIKATEEERQRKIDATKKFAGFPPEERARLEREDKSRKNREKKAKKKARERIKKLALKAAAEGGDVGKDEMKDQDGGSDSDSD